MVTLGPVYGPLTMFCLPWTSRPWFFALQNKKSCRNEELNMKKLLALTLALVLALALCACGGTATDDTATDDTAGGDTSTMTTLRVGMECSYAPYNWTQSTDANGAVAIANNPGSYANGYDVTIAKKIAEANGWDLEIYAIEWGGLSAALDADTIDMVIAGQSMTASRMQEVDMAGPYYYATIVCVVKDSNPLADATGISQLTGTCTAQTSTIWYDSCLPQVTGAQIMGAAETAPAMIMAVESGNVDFICTDMPTAMGACAAYSDLKILDFNGTDDDFQVSDEEVNIGISVKKGNTALLDAANAVLATMTEDDFNTLMNEAIDVQPEI